MSEDLYLIQKESLQNLANLIKTKSNIDTSIPVSFETLGSKLESLENGIYKQITEGIFTEAEASLDIQTLRPYMFYKSQGLNKLELTNSNLILAPAAFEESTITELTLSGLDSSVTSIPDRFFKSSSITSIYIPQAEQITSIGEWAFGGAIEITNLQDFTSLTSIGECAFYNKTLKNFPTLQNVTNIKKRAFYSSEIISQFDKNRYVMSLINLKKIEDYAFNRARLLTNDEETLGDIIINGEDIEIGISAFNAATLGQVDIGHSTFKSIGNNAFRACNAELLCYVDFTMSPSRFYKLANLDLASSVSSIFCISDNMYPLFGNEWIYHDSSFYWEEEVKEVIFKQYTFQNFNYNPCDAIHFYFVELEEGAITKEIQKYAFGQATIDGDVILSGIETIGEKAFYRALFAEREGNPTKTIQLGSVGNPVKSIALNAFEGLRTSTVVDSTTGEENFVINNLIINVYYDNRDYSEVGYPSDYMYGEDGKPLITEDAPLWGISGDLAEITTIIWSEAFPESTE